jgi:hypothetical protein
VGAIRESSSKGERHVEFIAAELDAQSALIVAKGLTKRTLDPDFYGSLQIF